MLLAGDGGDGAARALSRHRRSAGGGAGEAAPALRPSSTGSAPTATAATSTAARSTAPASRSPSASVAIFGTALGLAIGLVTGFVRRPVDFVVMRVMDALMSMPPVLLAIALMALTKREPRQRRPRDHHHRGAARDTAGARRRAFAARAAFRRGGDRRRHRLLRARCWRHILPNTIAPLLVQATYICAAAMITEAMLSFIGAGTLAQDPELGQHHGGGPQLFQVSLLLVLFPGVFLSLTVLAVNLVGDGLRDALDRASRGQRRLLSARARRRRSPPPLSNRICARISSPATASCARWTASPTTSALARPWRWWAKAVAARASLRSRSCGSSRRRPAASSAARSASPGAICSRLSEAEMREHPRQRDRDDLPGADDLAQSGAHDRRARSAKR